MTREEKKKIKAKQFEPKCEWALYNRFTILDVFPSHTKAKNALHWKLEDVKKYPYDYADDDFHIKPYKVK